MEPRVILEILDRAGRLKERVALGGLPALIGRGYSCDVILDDPYVSPEHVRLTRDGDGKLLLEDLASLNGMFAMPTAQRTARLVLDGNGEVRIGHSVLRFRPATHPVAEALPDRSGALSSVDGPIAAVALYLITALCVLLQTYMATFDRISLGELLSRLVPFGFIFLAWTGLWALTSRLLTHRFSFAAHCKVACAALLADMLQDLIIVYASFAFAWDFAAVIFDAFGNTLVLIGLLYGHLRLCTPAPGRRLAYVSVFIACSIVGIFAFRTYIGRSEFTAALEFPATLRPPAFRLAEPRSLDAFLAEAAPLQEKVDALAREN